MYPGRGGFREPGTSTFIRRDEGDESDLWRPIKQAIVGILALDAALTVPVLSLLLMGRWMFFPLGILLTLATWYLLLWLSPWDEVGRTALCGVVLMFAIVIAGIRGPLMWGWIDDGVQGFGNFLRLLRMPYRPWVLLILGCLWAIGAIRHVGKILAVFDVLLAIAWGWAWHSGIEISWLDWTISPGDTWAWTGLILFFSRIKWLYIFVWGWPIFVGCVILTTRLWAEAFAGDNELQLKNASIDEVNFWDLLVPGLFRRRKSLSRLTVREDKTYRYSKQRTDESPTMDVVTIPEPDEREDDYVGFLVHLITVGTLSQEKVKQWYSRSLFYGTGQYRGVHIGLRRAMIHHELIDDVGGSVGGKLNKEGQHWIANKIFAIAGCGSIPEDYRHLLDLDDPSPTPGE